MIKTCLITGGAGFIGSHLAEFLLEKGFRVIVMDNFAQSSYQNINTLKSHPLFRFIELDITSEAFSHHLSSLEVDYLFHLACPVGVSLVMQSGFDLFEKHYDASLILFNWAIKHRLPIFYASSSEVYGNPFQSNPLLETDAKDLTWFDSQSDRFQYGRLKRSLEIQLVSIAEKYAIPVRIGRFFNVFGPRQQSNYGMVIPRFVDAALSGNTLRIYGDGSQIRSFCPVSIAVEAISNLTFSKSPSNVTICNIGINQSISIKNLAEKIIAYSESSSIIEYIQPEKQSGRTEGIHTRIPDISQLTTYLNPSEKINWDQYLLEWINHELAQQRIAKSM